MTSPAPDFSLHKRTALVTGARSGIGRACALALAAAGADVLCWGRSGDVGDTANEVRALGRQAWTVGSDLRDLDVTRAHVSRLLDDHHVDVLVNNAGIIRRAPAAETTLQDWRDVLTVNLDSAFVMATLVGRQMLANEWGRIINMASLLSFQGGVRVPAYTASKHGITGLTKALANEWAAPAGRWGEPEDVAAAVVFLASPAARYVNGHVLVVDGGWLAR